MHTGSHRVSRLDDEIGDIHAPYGSRKWAIAIGLELKREISELSREAKFVANWLEAAEKYEAWKAMGYPSFDMWLIKAIKLDPEQAYAIRNAKPGQFLKDLPELKDRGGQEGNQNAVKGKPQEERNELRNTKFVFESQTAAYTLARLHRDHPELAKQVEAGELTPNAAAIQAGFRRKMITVPVGDLPATVRALLRHYDVHELRRVIDELG